MADPLISLPNAFGSAVDNMAIDAALLDTVGPNRYLIRHYAWIEPTATFGYTQKLSDVSQLAKAGRTLIRRLSGGGYVDHTDDWTYAIIAGPETSLYRQTPEAVYRKLHQSIVDALMQRNVSAALAPCHRTCNHLTEQTRSNERTKRACFPLPTYQDVVNSEGEKVAGAALKRQRSGLLIQGSILRSRLPEPFDYRSFQAEFAETLCSRIGAQRNQPEDIRPSFSTKAITVRRDQFTEASWNSRR